MKMIVSRNNLATIVTIPPTKTVGDLIDKYNLREKTSIRNLRFGGKVLPIETKLSLYSENSVFTSGKVVGTKKIIPRRKPYYMTRTRRVSRCRIPCRKPRVFLGKKPIVILKTDVPLQNVSVEVDLKESEFTSIYPATSSSSKNAKWENLTVLPGEKILMGKKEYPYLFWEADLTTMISNSEASPPGYRFTPENLDKALTQTGLTSRERSDLITYWLGTLPSVCSFRVLVNHPVYEAMASLTISPPPASVHRVFVIFKEEECDNEVPDLPPLVLPTDGFRVLEWGGGLID